MDFLDGFLWGLIAGALAWPAGLLSMLIVRVPAGVSMAKRQRGRGS